MKKLLLVLGMITCMLGTAACGKAEDTSADVFMSEEEAVSNAEYVVELLYMVEAQGMADQYADYPVVMKALESWRIAAEDMGDYKEIKESEATVEESSAVVNVTVAGTKRDAVVEVVLDKTGFTSISTNVVYTTGEKMQKAVLNTLMGMGTVFAVLILISLIIGLFNYIPKIQEKFTKQEAPNEIKSQAVNNTIAQIVEKEEELTDDLELVAVISAAIAASEGAVSADGFVVRSIKRANTNKWKNA